MKDYKLKQRNLLFENSKKNWTLFFSRRPRKMKYDRQRILRFLGCPVHPRPSPAAPLLERVCHLHPTCGTHDTRTRCTCTVNSLLHLTCALSSRIQEPGSVCPHTSLWAYRRLTLSTTGVVGHQLSRESAYGFNSAGPIFFLIVFFTFTFSLTHDQPYATESMTGSIGQRLLT